MIRKKKTKNIELNNSLLKLMSDNFMSEKEVILASMSNQNEFKNLIKIIKETPNLGVYHSVRINPFLPQYVKDLATSYQKTELIIKALLPSHFDSRDTILHWKRSILVEYVNAISWRLMSQQTFHKYSTLPHILLIALMDSESVINWIRKDENCSLLIAPINFMIEKEQFEQLGATFNELKSAILKECPPTPYFNWMLTTNVHSDFINKGLPEYEKVEFNREFRSDDILILKNKMDNKIFNELVLLHSDSIINEVEILLNT